MKNKSKSCHCKSALLVCNDSFFMASMPFVFLSGNDQPFIEPTITPFTKYFWMKGYTHMMGIVATIMDA